MRKELTDEELETYSRQIVLADIGVWWGSADWARRSR